MNEAFSAPDHLSERSQRLYRFYIGKAATTPGQIAILVTALEALDEADQCSEIIAKEGLATTSARSGVTRQHPLIRTRQEAKGAMLKAFKLLRLERDSYRTPGMLGYEVDYETTEEKGHTE